MPQHQQASKGRSGFTLIELLVVIAIIALLIGILIPALSKARDSARTLKCLTNTRGMGTIFTLYANDNKSWYPVIPEVISNGILDGQASRGGVSGLFSLNQVGDESQAQVNLGHGGGPNSDNETDILHSYPNVVNNTLVSGIGGSRVPLMRNYMTGYDILNCPSDKEDIYYGRAFSSSWEYGTYSGDQGPRIPRIPAGERAISWTSVSYLYIAGLKTDEPNIPFPPPLWGDETNGPDVGTKAWYGATANGTGLNESMQKAGVQFNGGYGRVDNHGAAGANFVYADGHAAFVRGSIQAEFFKGRGEEGSQRSINAVNPNRSGGVQTID